MAAPDRSLREGASRGSAQTNYRARYIIYKTCEYGIALRLAMERILNIYESILKMKKIAGSFSVKIYFPDIVL